MTVQLRNLNQELPSSTFSLHEIFTSHPTFKTKNVQRIQMLKYKCSKTNTHAQINKYKCLNKQIQMLQCKITNAHMYNQVQMLEYTHEHGLYRDTIAKKQIQKR